MLDDEATLSHEPDVYPYDHSGNDESVGGFSENLLVQEYSLLQLVHALAALMDVFTVLYPQLQDLDSRRDLPSLGVPVSLAQGRHEAPGRAEPAEQGFTALDAPVKERTVFETSGHRPMFEQPADSTGSRSASSTGPDQLGHSAPRPDRHPTAQEQHEEGADTPADTRSHP